MSIKNDKERIIISLPKTQIKWLNQASKKAGLSKSKFISWFLARKVDELYNFMKINENRPSDEELKTIMEIINTKWL